MNPTTNYEYMYVRPCPADPTYALPGPKPPPPMNFRRSTMYNALYLVYNNAIHSVTLS